MLRTLPAAVILASSVVFAQSQPVAVFVAPVSNKIVEYQAGELDKLVVDGLKGLEQGGKLKSVPEASADVTVRPELATSETGKVRLSWTMQNRAHPALADRIAFDFNSTKFGPMGVSQMLNGVADHAIALRDRGNAATVAANTTTTSGTGGGATGTGGTTSAGDAPLAEPAEAGRFRWGVSTGVGTFIPGPLISFGAEARAGWQFNRMFAVYASIGVNGGFGIGGSASSTGGSVFIGADAYWYVGAQGEATFGDMFYVAGGPQLARGGWAFLGQSADVNGNVSQVARAAGGFMPAFDLKLGLGFGARNANTGRRNQFTIAIDTMFLFAPNTVTGSQTVNMNGVTQTVDTRGVAVGIAPMLMFGYDGR